MAILKEDEQSRETLEGSGGGWGARRAVVPDGQPLKAVIAQRTPEPAEPVTDAPEESSPSPEAPQDEAQGSETDTPPSNQPEPQPAKPWNQPPPERWEEMRQARLAAEQRAAQAESLARMALERTQPQAPVVPEQNPWDGLVNHQDPATAQYWQLQQRLHQHAMQQAKQQAIQELRPVIEAGTAEIARLNLKEFRKENAEIKPGSEEERLVIAYMNGQMDGNRHTLESAKRNAMYDHLQAENQQLRQKHSATPMKRQAAASETSSGMPATAGLPGKASSPSERASHALERGGNWMQAAKEFFS